MRTLAALLSGLLFVFQAGAEAAVGLQEDQWQLVSGSWEFTGEQASASVQPGESAAVLLKATELRDFELTYSFQATEGIGGVAFRAHQSADYQEAHKTLNLGVPGLYGMGVFATSDSLRLLVNDGAERRALGSVAVGESAEWHNVKVRVEGDRVQVWLDDKSIAEATDEAFIGGGLALCLSVPDGGKEGKIAVRDLQLTDLGRTGNWRSLFNGKDTAGWKEWGTEKWSVEDGVIYGRSGPKKSEGYLATEETWTSFRVRGRFQMLGEGNFGLFYHSTIKLREDDQYPVISGVQGEVEPAHPSSTGWLYESYKRGWLVEPPKNTLGAYVLDPTGWNEIEIRSEGKVVTTWVNGVRALSFDDPEPLLTEGSFALQLHAGGVDGIAWKDLYVLDK